MSDDDDGAPPPGPWRLAGGLVLVASLGAVAITFLLALGAGRVGPDLGIVVVADPVPRREPTPILVRVVGPTSVVPLAGAVNGRPVDADGVVEVPTDRGVDVVGEVFFREERVRVALHFLLPGAPLSTTLSVSKTPTLAIPSTGAAVFPVEGLAAPAGPSTVVLVDDDDVRFIDVDVAVDGRLPDGRLLAVDRRPLSATLEDDGDGGPVLEVRARRDVDGMVSLTVGGRVRVIAPLRLAAGATATVGLPSGDRAAVGDLVVAAVSTAVVPGVDGASDLQLVGRVGGLTEGDLRLVEARAERAFADPRVRAALGRRLRVDGGTPSVVSPTLAGQRRDQLKAARRDADDARGRFRMAAIVLLSAVALTGVLGGRQRSPGALVPALVAAVVLVGALVLGLDRVLEGLATTGAVDDLGATSGSP